MRLVYERSWIEVAVGDEVVLSDGTRDEVTGWTKPHHGGSTGRVHLKGGMSYFPSVIGAKWIEREDQ